MNLTTSKEDDKLISRLQKIYSERLGKQSAISIVRMGLKALECAK